MVGMIVDCIVCCYCMAFICCLFVWFWFVSCFCLICFYLIVIIVFFIIFIIIFIVFIFLLLFIFFSFFLLLLSSSSSSSLSSCHSYYLHVVLMGFWLLVVDCVPIKSFRRLSACHQPINQLQTPLHHSLTNSQTHSSSIHHPLQSSSVFIIYLWGVGWWMMMSALPFILSTMSNV